MLDTLERLIYNHSIDRADGTLFLLPGVEFSAYMPNSLRDSYKLDQDGSAVMSLVWTVHLAKREPLKFFVALSLCLAAALIGYVLINNPFPVVITTAVLLAAISDFLLPVTYKLGPLGASSTSFLFRRKIRWEDVKACYLDDSGVKLSPIGVRSPREAFRGVYLRFDHNRDEVIMAVKALRKTDD